MLRFLGEESPEGDRWQPQVASPCVERYVVFLGSAAVAVQCWNVCHPPSCCPSASSSTPWESSSVSSCCANTENSAEQTCSRKRTFRRSARKVAKLSKACQLLRESVRIRTFTPGAPVKCSLKPFYKGRWRCVACEPELLAESPMVTLLAADLERQSDGCLCVYKGGLLFVRFSARDFFRTLAAKYTGKDDRLTYVAPLLPKSCKLDDIFIDAKGCPVVRRGNEHYELTFEIVNSGQFVVGLNKYDVRSEEEDIWTFNSRLPDIQKYVLRLSGDRQRLHIFGLPFGCNSVPLSENEILEAPAVNSGIMHDIPLNPPADDKKDGSISGTETDCLPSSSLASGGAARRPEQEQSAGLPYELKTFTTGGKKLRVTTLKLGDESVKASIRRVGAGFQVSYPNGKRLTFDPTWSLVKQKNYGNHIVVTDQQVLHGAGHMRSSPSLPGSPAQWFFSLRPGGTGCAFVNNLLDERVVFKWHRFGGEKTLGAIEAGVRKALAILLVDELRKGEGDVARQVINGLDATEQCTALVFNKRIGEILMGWQQHPPSGDDILERLERFVERIPEGGRIVLSMDRNRKAYLGTTSDIYFWGAYTLDYCLNSGITISRVEPTPANPSGILVDFCVDERKQHILTATSGAMFDYAIFRKSKAGYRLYIMETGVNFSWTAGETKNVAMKMGTNQTLRDVLVFPGFQQPHSWWQKDEKWKDDPTVEHKEIAAKIYAKMLRGRITRRNISKFDIHCFWKALENRFQCAMRTEGWYFVGPRYCQGWVVNLDGYTKLRMVETVLENLRLTQHWSEKVLSNRFRFGPQFETYFMVCWVPTVDITKYIPDSELAAEASIEHGAQELAEMMRRDGSTDYGDYATFYNSFPVWIPVLPSGYVVKKCPQHIIDEGNIKTLKNGVRVLHVTDFAKLPDAVRKEFVQAVLGDSDNKKNTAAATESSSPAPRTSRSGSGNLSDTRVNYGKAFSMMDISQSSQEPLSSTVAATSRLRPRSMFVRSPSQEDDDEEIDDSREFFYQSYDGVQSAQRSDLHLPGLYDNDTDAEADEKLGTSTDDSHQTSEQTVDDDMPMDLQLFTHEATMGTRFLALWHSMEALRCRIDPVYGAVRQLSELDLAAEYATEAAQSNEKLSLKGLKQYTEKYCDENYVDIIVGKRPDGIGRLLPVMDLKDAFYPSKRWPQRMIGQHLYTSIRGVVEKAQKLYGSAAGRLVKTKKRKPWEYRNFEKAPQPQVDHLRDVFYEAAIEPCDERPAVQPTVATTPIKPHLLHSLGMCEGPTDPFVLAKYQDESDRSRQLWRSLTRALEHMFYDADTSNHRGSMMMEYTAQYGVLLSDLRDSVQKFEKKFTPESTKGQLRRYMHQFLRGTRAQLVALDITRRAEAYRHRGWLRSFSLDVSSTARVTVDLPVFVLRRDPFQPHEMTLRARRPVDALFVCTYMSTATDQDAINIVGSDGIGAAPTLLKEPEKNCVAAELEDSKLPAMTFF